MVKNLVLKYPRTAALLWAVLILILCGTPGSYVPSASWMEMLSVDKLVHAGIFFVQATLCFLIVKRSESATSGHYLWLTACIFYGVLLEWLQANVFSERSSDIYDMAANTAGCLIALVLRQRIMRSLNGQNVSTSA
jgi:VanZ family protein